MQMAENTGKLNRCHGVTGISMEDTPISPFGGIPATPAPVEETPVPAIGLASASGLFRHDYSPFDGNQFLSAFAAGEF